jgi:DNA-binding NtrC family response regulator
MDPLQQARVVLWTESPGELASIEQTLSQHGFTPRSASTLEQLMEWVASHSVDVVVAWLCQSYRGPLALLTKLKGLPAAPPVLVVSCGLDVNLYLEAMRRGAFDCVASPVDETELVRVVSAALEESGLRLSA